MIHVHIYTGKGQIEDGFIRFHDKIIEVNSMNNYTRKTDEKVIDGKGQIVIPGMIDIHTHGGYGIDFMDANVKKIKELSRRMLNEGITTFFATTITQHPQAIEQALKAIKQAKDSVPMIKGINLEGPYVSKKRAGAQPLAYITPPNIEQFLQWYEISGQLIKLVTYAPELEGAKKFEQIMIDKEIILSVGHSDAVRDQLLPSAATHATHLFNGMRGLHHREVGVAGHALLSDEMFVEVIADGVHIHPDMLKLTYQLKGAEKICVITDAMRAKGMPDGEYELGGQQVFVKDGEARLENGSLAGSVLTMDQAFRNIITFTGCSVEEAVQMTSGNQAREFSLKNKGFISAGMDADFVRMTDQFEIIETYKLGKAFRKGGNR